MEKGGNVALDVVSSAGGEETEEEGVTDEEELELAWLIGLLRTEEERDTVLEIVEELDRVVERAVTAKDAQLH